MYAIQSIFRTSEGLIPGYGLAHPIPGTYEFVRPIILINGRQTHVVNTCIIKEKQSYKVLATNIGHYTAHKDIKGRKSLETLYNFPLRMYDPPKWSIPVKNAGKEGFYAAVASMRKDLFDTNRLINNLNFMPLVTKPIPEKKYLYYLKKYHFNFCHMSKPSIHSWMFHILQTYYKAKKLIISSDMTIVEMHFDHCFYKDLFMMIFKYLGIEFKVSYMISHGVFYFKMNEFSNLVKRLLSVHFTKVWYAMDFINNVSDTTSLIIEENGDQIISREQHSAEMFSRRTVYKIKEAYGTTIEFPEIEGEIEHNGFVLVDI